MTIAIIGSFMMDHVVTTERAPVQGETIIGESFQINPGGKGANQAATIAKLNAEVYMIGKVGQDVNGDQFIDVLSDIGVNTENILRTEAAVTGVGIITIEQNGDNRIIVVPGANMQYTYDEFEVIKPLIKTMSLVGLQLEMDFEVTTAIINDLHELNIPILLNPAPARPLSDELLAKISYLTPNETELALLSESTVETIDDAIKAAQFILAKGVKNIIVTLGDQGALIVTNDQVEHIAGYSVKAIDTVAAGDSFNGAFMVKVSEGSDLISAVKYANAVGALTTTQKGAIPALPDKETVEKFISEHQES